MAVPHEGALPGDLTPNSHTLDLHNDLGLATQAELDAHAADNDLHGGAAEVAAHEAAGDPHPVYQTSAEVDAKIATHAGLVDPHSGYATDADLTAHEGAADPHPGYSTAAETTAAIASHTASADAHHAQNHASRHATAGADPLSPSTIGAADEVHTHDPELGAVTAGGSPATVINDASHNNFPSLARLDDARVLVVYRKGTTHLAGGNIVGKIGTLNAARTAVSSWGSEFTILDEADDLRIQDAASVVDGRVVISFRRYDGSANHDPALLISDVQAADLTSTSTWTTVEITLTEGSLQNYTSGRLLKLANGRYLQPYGSQDTAADHIVGVLLSDSLTSWASPTVVNVGATADYSEIAVDALPDGSLVALLRNDDTTSIYVSTSSDFGATWSAPASAYDGHGFPTFRRLLSGNTLTAYRDAPNADTAWRVSTDDGATWGSETILDTTGTRSAYTSLLQLTESKVLCAYAVEHSSDGSTGGGDIYTQVFTDASTGYPYHRNLDGVGPDDHHSQSHNAAGADHWTDETDTSLVLSPDGSGGVAFRAESVGGGGGYAEGTSFPGSPATNDKYYRTDRNLLYFWDGSRWLTTELFVHAAGSVSSASVTNSIVGRIAIPLAYDAYFVDLHLMFVIGVTNTGSAYWEAELAKYDSSAVKTRIGSSAESTAALSASQRVRKTLAINTLYTTADSSPDVLVNLLKTGSPSNLTCSASVSYRLVG